MRQDAFWSRPADEVARALGSSPDGGLPEEEAASRLRRFGPNTIGAHRRRGSLAILATQFANPIVLILIAAAILSYFLKDTTDAVIIIVIVLVSGLLSFFQERGAADAVAKLVEVVRVKADVIRGGRQLEVPSEAVVPGDVVVLSAGDAIPGDCVVIASRELFVDEAALTGESYPAEKLAGTLPADTPLAKRTNTLFMGTHVVSGSGSALVVNTARSTVFGAVADRVATRRPETEFERGVRRFGYLLVQVTGLLVFGIFVVAAAKHQPVLESFLFALALAVGLTPQLLPAIISVNLAHGARQMAKRKVIVKRLASIENFGSMDILCSDKTGTLTTGVVKLKEALGANGEPSEATLALARVNASFETGFSNPIDDALRAGAPPEATAGWKKLDEEPYDFIRKRISILAEHEGERSVVTKGSLATVLDICDSAELADGSVVPLHTVHADIMRIHNGSAAQGLRTLGVAVKRDVDLDRIDRSHETGLTFLGMLLFFDPPKEGVASTVERLRGLGVRLKIITGDNAQVASTLGGQMGLDSPVVLTGPQLAKMGDRALDTRALAVDIFAEIEPNQKERIVRALRTHGDVVGYIGDGINDASALHAADVSISVESAVDVAKDAADIVLLEKDLAVLVDGVMDGRSVFANTLKYVFMATSANFGNMFSMAGATLFLNFLPLLPTQVLLTNLATDVPELTIATDHVDPELTEEPRRWDVGFIRRFMIVFGLLSSVFDFATFGVLLFLLHVNTNPAGVALFRTAWFTESVLSASMVVLIIRTRRTFWASRPGTPLALATAGVWVAILALPYTPLGAVFHFAAMPPLLYGLIGVILVAYAASAELAKRLFYRAEARRKPRPGDRMFPARLRRALEGTPLEMLVR